MNHGFNFQNKKSSFYSFDEHAFTHNQPPHQQYHHHHHHNTHHRSLLHK